MVETRYAVQNQIDSGVWVRSMTVPARQRVIPLTGSTREKVWPVDEAAGFAGFAPSADEPLAPADAFKVSGSILIVTKEPLELWDRTRKWQIRMRQHDGVAISPLQSLGVNRTRTELTMKLKS